MSTQVIVILPDPVFRRIERLAQLTQRDVEDVVVDTLEISLSSVGEGVEEGASVTALTDAEVLALSHLEMEPAQDRRLSHLLDRQQAGELTASEQRDLWALMQVYQEGLLRKAQAMREAVRRGLLTAEP